jgi:hypothetical protein
VLGFVRIPTTRRLPPALAALGFVSASLAMPQVPAGDREAGGIEGPGRAYVSQARGLALGKLRQPVCRGIFAEFRNGNDASLDEVLRGRGESADEHLLRMRLRDGTGHGLCVVPGAYAVTQVGSFEVFLCGSFSRLARHDAHAAANVLIHEELHSLGAGEAPMRGLPSSEWITARVGILCGR